jgi:hypothetical protein
VSKAFRGIPEYKAFKVRQVSRVKPELLDKRESKVRPVFRDGQEFKVRLASVEILVLLEIPEHRAQLVFRDKPVSRVFKV